MTRLITCENLSASYGANCVFSNLSFYANSGEVLSILGENGAGKSTLLKCLLGLKKQDSGTISTHDFLQNQVGYLPQQAEIKQDFPASVFEVVLSGCLNLRGAKPFYTRRERDVACRNLERLEILDLKKKSFQSLSGGQRQRVLLARALCCAKKLLILDEPTAGLDPIAAKEFYALMNKLKHEDDLGIIMVSHDTFGALSVSERILHLSHDKDLSFFGTKDMYLTSDFHALERRSQA